MADFPLGAPSKYKAHYALELIKYFSVKPYERVEKDSKTYAYKPYEPSDYPSFAGFAIHIGVSRHTIRNWAEEYPEFGEAYQLAKDYQENWLLVNGLKGAIPPQFAQFILINNSDYRQKSKDEAPDTVIAPVGVDPKDPDFEQKWNERVSELEKKLGRK